MIYLDSSAVVKLVRTEPCTPDLVNWLRGDENAPRVSSALVEVEVPRALRRSAPDALYLVPATLGAMYRVEINSAIRAAAGAFTNPRVRSLDAIHLATASQLVPELRAFVTYDMRLFELADRAGLPAVAPGR